MLHPKVGKMKKVIVLISLILTVSVSAHCPLDFKEVDLCADVTWISGPVLNQKSHFQILFWEKGDAGHVAISPEEEVSVDSWMVMHNGMDHAGPSMSPIEISNGLFDVPDARFFMHGSHGYWELIIKLSKDGNIVSEARHKVEFSGNDNGHGDHHNHDH